MASVWVTHDAPGLLILLDYWITDSIPWVSDRCSWFPHSSPRIPDPIPRFRISVTEFRIPKPKHSEILDSRLHKRDNTWLKSASRKVLKIRVTLRIFWTMRNLNHHTYLRKSVMACRLQDDQLQGTLCRFKEGAITFSSVVSPRHFFALTSWPILKLKWKNNLKL